MPPKTSASRVIVLSIAACLSFAGCSENGEKSDSAKTEDSLRAKFGEDNWIIANIVVRAYEQGRLGTREQVEADMEPFFSPTDYPNKIPKPFDDSGKLLSLSSMNDEQLIAFSKWYRSGKVYGLLRDEINTALAENQKKKG